ncbi:MAG: MFS transporter [Thermoflavifilum sp.]|nr:MFS transporter [Thermoflavifilum sp.]MCL6512963.1 MFS transporter [Alicyclobacillus sp.]
MWGIAAAGVVNLAGLSLLWPINAIYVHTQLGLPMTTAGLILMLYSGAGFVGSLVAGWMFDHLGPLRTLALSTLIAAGAMLAAAAWMKPAVYIAVMGVFGLASSMPFPVFNALVSVIWPEGGRRAFNFIYVANNLGVAVGTALGGIVAAWSYRAVFLGVGLSTVVCMVLAYAALSRTSGWRGHVRASARHHTAAHDIRLPWGTILAVWLGFVGCWMVYVQWQANVSVFMQSLGYPLRAYSWLWTLNGLLIFALQPLVALGARRLPRLSVHMTLGAVLIGAAYIVVSLSHRYIAFISGMVLLTIGEVWAWPAVPAAMARVSPSERRGLVQGLTGAGATFGRMVGPVLGGWLYDRGDVHLLWTACSVFMIVPILLFLMYSRWAETNEAT